MAHWWHWSVCFAQGSAGTTGTVTGWVLVGVVAAAVPFLAATVLRERLRAGR